MFQGRKFRPRGTKFPGASLTERCGATCSKGPGNSGLAEFLGARNLKIRLSPFQRAVVQLSGKCPEILLRQNFQGPEILEFPAPAIFC
jgi:hypothetical protein